MDELLERLEIMGHSDLREFWVTQFDDEPPNVRATDLLRRRIAWKLQQDRFCGLSTTTKRRLRELAMAYDRDENHKPSTQRKLQSGAELTREWKGKVHTVQVRPDGYVYNGKKYKGLSKIAREITGTRWSGPLFFGLRKPKSRVRTTS